jgi:hypothetical protein
MTGTPDLLPIWAVSLAAAFCFFPLKNELSNGQIDAVILILWTLGVYLLQGQRPLASGFCFALGTVIKVCPAIAVPFLVMRRQWTWLASYVASVIILTAASVWRLGWESHATWLQAVLPMLSCGIAISGNRSLPGFVAALCNPRSLLGVSQGLPGGLCLFNKGLGTVILFGFLFWCWNKNRGTRALVRELTLLPLVYLLAAPISWRMHFVLAALPLAYLWTISRQAARNAELLTLSLSTVILGINIPDYVAVAVRETSSFFAVAAVGLWPVATAALIWTGMRIYRRAGDSDASQPVAAGGQPSAFVHGAR